MKSNSKNKIASNNNNTLQSNKLYILHTRAYIIGNRYIHIYHKGTAPIMEILQKRDRYHSRSTLYIVEMQIFFFHQKSRCSSYYFCMLCSPHRAFPLAKTWGRFASNFVLRRAI